MIPLFIIRRQELKTKEEEEVADSL